MGHSNASVTWSTEDRRWEGKVFVNNLGDTEYLVQTFDLSGDVLGLTEQYYGRPEWWGASVTYRWGP